MKKLIALMVLFMLAIIPAINCYADNDDNLFTGEKKLACEAIICLSSGTRPDECDESIKHFYSIKKKKLSDTKDARKNFLKKCPESDDDGKMVSLIDVLVDYNCSACTVKQLNARFVEVRIITRGRYRRNGKFSYKTVNIVDPELLSYCQKYYAAIGSHEYTAYSTYSEMPVYVGHNLGVRHKDNNGDEYYMMFARSSSDRNKTAELIAELTNNHWEWNQ